MSKTETNFADIIANISDKRVKTMSEKIKESFARRDEFEGANAQNSGSSYCVNRDKVLKNAVAVSKLLIALNKKPDEVIERHVNSSKMFNAKALKKIVELAQFACGVRKVENIEKVMTSFILCSLKYSSDSDSDVISNSANKAFLSSVDLSQIVENEALAEYIADYRHAYISGGKDTQSSQARNVLDVLGLGEIVTCDNRHRGGIKVDSDNAFLRMVCDAATK